ncbi:hypothetical protein [Sorangium sp. So ce388]
MLRLRELPARAAEQLVLGAAIMPGRVSALVQRAGGNTFYRARW